MRSEGMGEIAKECSEVKCREVNCGEDVKGT
jgi:hypothetical protein